MEIRKLRNGTGARKKKRKKKNMLDNLEFEEGNSFFAEATWMNGTTWEVHVCFLLQ